MQAGCTGPDLPAIPCKQSAGRTVGPLTDSPARAVSTPLSPSGSSLATDTDLFTRLPLGRDLPRVPPSRRPCRGGLSRAAARASAVANSNKGRAHESPPRSVRSVEYPLGRGNHRPVEKCQRWLHQCCFDDNGTWNCVYDNVVPPRKVIAVIDGQIELRIIDRCPLHPNSTMPRRSS